MKSVSLFSLPAAIIALLCVSDAFALKFVAYGDTRTSKSAHQSVVNAFAKENPELVIHSGDIWDGYTAGEWKTIISSQTSIKNLLNANLFLVARGNHETEAAVKAFSPTILREGKIQYSFRVGNCFFVSMGYSPATNTSFLQQALNSTDSKTADWRFVFAHVPVYSGGEHGASGIAAVETILDTYKVSAYFAGHDHHYERTHLIKNKAVVTKDPNAGTKEGTVYYVTGGGGAPLRSVTARWWTGSSSKVYHYLLINATASTLTITAKNQSGQVIDVFTMNKGAVAADRFQPDAARNAIGITGRQHNGRIFGSIPNASEAHQVRMYNPRGQVLESKGIDAGQTGFTVGTAIQSSGLRIVEVRSADGSRTGRGMMAVTK